MEHDTSAEVWKRNCKHREENEQLGCTQHKWMGGVILVDECICEVDLCNGVMGPIPESTTTTKSTTTMVTTTRATTTKATTKTTSTAEKNTTSTPGIIQVSGI